MACTNSSNVQCLFREGRQNRTDTFDDGCIPTQQKMKLALMCNLAVRVIGASTKKPPAFSTAAAMRLVDSGSAVEQSTTTVPGCSAVSTPSGPVRMASTWGTGDAQNDNVCLGSDGT